MKTTTGELENYQRQTFKFNSVNCEKKKSIQKTIGIALKKKKIKNITLKKKKTWKGKERLGLMCAVKFHNYAMQCFIQIGGDV